MPGNVSIVCNMVVTKFFFSISEQNNPKIVRKYRAAWNFLQIYFETLSDYASRIIIIDLVTVFDAILTSRQTREKLQCLYENLMMNNFRKTAVVKKISIVN